MADTANFEGALIRLLRLVEARNLKEVQRITHQGAPALAVADAVFVSLSEPHVAALHCPVDQKVLLMEISPDIFFETDSHIGQDVLLVRLDRIEDEELALKLEDAWHFRAPDRLKR
jgi:hypothetical protein